MWSAKRHQMWRQRSFAKDSGSDDQSISDEEELSGGEDAASFGGNAEGNEPSQLQSRLEMLRGRDHVHSESKIGIPEDDIIVFEEDDVEMPDFPEEGGFANDDIVTIDENGCAISKHTATTDAKSCDKDNYAIMYRCAEQDEAHAWSAAHKEAEMLICKKDIAPPSASGFCKANKYRKGIMGKAKPKLSFQIQSHDEGRPLKSFISNDGDDGYTSNEFSDLPGQPGVYLKQQEDSNGRNEQQQENMLPQVKAVGHSFVEHSMAEILDGLQDRNNMPRRISKMSCRTRESRGKLVIKKSIPMIENTAIADEDQPELVSSGSSSDGDAYDQNTKLSGIEMKKQTMADRFHNALAATSSNNEGEVFMVPKQSCLGLFGKLQQVMQREKDHDTDFLMNLQNEAKPMSESHFIVVKILSRHLEAKLTVCQCYSVENKEPYDRGSQWFEDSEAVIKNGRRRVIFNPRICSDVELEVGNLIRIHHPWKEIRLEEDDECVVLSAYFSQIFM